MIRLPRALLEEIGSSAPASPGIWRAPLVLWKLTEFRNPGRSKGKLSRKDNRKLERIASKKRKAQHHATKQPQELKRPAQEAHEDAPVAKKPRVSAPPPEAKVSSPKPKKKTPLQRLVDSSSGNHSLPRTREEGKEDEYIRYLEGKLGWKKNRVKTSAYASGLADDGLDGMCTSFSIIYAESTQDSITELLADLDTFESSVVCDESDEIHQLQLKLLPDSSALWTRYVRGRGLRF